MAWRFPVDCSCARFKAQIAIRPWIGGQIINYLGANVASQGSPLFFFLGYRLTSTGCVDDGAARLPPFLVPYTTCDYTVEWSIAPESYGDFSVLGDTVRLVPEGTPLHAFTVGSPPSAVGQIGQPGHYEFTCTSGLLDPPAQYVLSGFVRGSSTSIRLTDNVTLPALGGGSFLATVTTQEFTNQLTPQLLGTILQADLDQRRTLNTDPVPRGHSFGNNPQGFPVGFQALMDIFPVSRGGFYEEEEVVTTDAESPTEHMIDRAFRWTSGEFPPGSTRGDDDVIRGHSARFTAGYMGRFFGGGIPNYSYYPAFLLRSQIYEPGLHSYRNGQIHPLVSLIPGVPPTPLPNPSGCAEITVGCGASVQLNPPFTTSTRSVLNFNTPCH